MIKKVIILADANPIHYTKPLDDISRKYINWDEIGKNKKIVSRLKNYIKSELRKEFGNTCYFCKETVHESNSYFEIEHILTKSQDEYRCFTFNPKNFALCCKECNNLKGMTDVLSKSAYKPNYVYKFDEYPFESEQFDIIHPYIDNYDEHIDKKGIFYLVKDNSEKGANTIKYYHLARLSLAETKINKINKIQDQVLRQALDDKSPTTQVERHSSLIKIIYNIEGNQCNTKGVTHLIDKCLNPADISKKNQNRIAKIKKIDKNNFRDFIEFRKMINKMNSLTPNWYNTLNWDKDPAYIDAFNKSSCFNGRKDREIVLENITIVIMALKGLYGTNDLRENLECITIRDVHKLISTFNGYFNNQSYVNNEQLELIYPLRYAIYCSAFYECEDITNDIHDKLTIDAKIVEDVKKIFKELRKQIS